MASATLGSEPAPPEERAANALTDAESTQFIARASALVRTDAAEKYAPKRVSTFVKAASFTAVVPNADALTALEHPNAYRPPG
jgi:hypothetical protein